MTEATGAQLEIELMVGKDPARMWDLITDVARIGEWSPECVGAEWLDGGGPKPGARFAGHNRYGGGFEATVTCVVTEAVQSAAGRPGVFEWVVLDPTEEPSHPGSVWRYELEPGESAGQTKVRHRFVHGPGQTGLSEAMADHPDEAAAILQGRLDKLRWHMTLTLEGMARS
jgi:Polyketide cyclase / dehydrase and lipid transport